MTIVFLAAILGQAAAQAPALQLPPGHPPLVPVVSSYVPERVFDTRRNAFGDFELMLADLARADVVLVGEQHDDPNTHRLEAAILQGLLRRNVQVAVSLEMFERDVQAGLDAYLAATSPRTPSSRMPARGRATRPTIGRSSRPRASSTGASSRPTCRGGWRPTSRNQGRACSTACRR